MKTLMKVWHTFYNNVLSIHYTTLCMSEIGIVKLEAIVFASNESATTKTG